MYQRGGRKKGDKKGSGMLAIVFGRGTNLDIAVAQDTFPAASILISANEEPSFFRLEMQIMCLLHVPRIIGVYMKLL